MERNTSSAWSSGQVYTMAVICLLIGIAAGYLIRGPQIPTAASAGAAQTSAAPAGTTEQQVTPEQLKHMADTKAAPLLEQLKRQPNDPQLLAEIGNVYYDTQNYRDAIGYYGKSLAARDNPDVRTDMGTAYFYSGDPDTAIREFQKVLKSDPSHGNALFNMGMVKWQGKMDVNGAVAAWEELLRKNPNHPRRAEVEQLIARAKQHANVKPGQKTDRPAM